MKKSIVLFVSIFWLFSCGSGEHENGPGITISGKVEKPPAEGGMIELEHYETDGVKVVAEVELEGNEYQIKLDTATPGYYRLNFFDSQFVQLILNNKDITVNVEGDSPTGDVEVIGSPEMDFTEKVKKIYAEMQEEINSASSKYARATLTKEEEEELYGKMVEIQRKYSNQIKEEIDNLGANIAALNAISYLNPDDDFEYIDNLATQLSEAYPDNQEVLNFAQQVEDLRALAIGAEAPEFTLTSMKGEEVSLSSYQGNYVLIDFWAAWCQPCRKENPNLVEAYLAYEDQGFEILGVSLDQNEESWLKAVEKDELIWTQVRDVQNEVAEEYQIQAIPANFLLDKEGKIIAKNLRGPALKDKLSKLFP